MQVVEAFAPVIELVPASIAAAAEWNPAERIDRAEATADVIASAGDVFGLDAEAAKKAEVTPAQLCDAVAAGLGVLAHRPEGVNFAGMHWCAGDHDCPGPGEYDLPETRIGRSARGAVFTPRSLAEEATDWALEAVVYDGPLTIGDRSKWRLLSSAEILSKSVGDIAAGSGAFFLSACRYIADRLCEAWAIEAGSPGEKPTASMVLLARQLAMRHCVYGADIDPASVELSKVALALLAPTVDVDLSGNIVAGDSLLGIHTWSQIEAMHFAGDQADRVFERAEMHAMLAAHHFNPAASVLPFALADLVSAAALYAEAKRSKRHQADVWSRAAELGRRLYADPTRLAETTALTQEWMQADLPNGCPPRRPLHWPLTFPHIFKWGSPGWVRSTKGRNQ